MEARLRKDADVNIIHIYGHLSYEEVDRFADVCKQIRDQKVVFNFDGLHFVGSCGITAFFEAIQDLHMNSKVKPKMCGLSVEFKKYADNAQVQAGEHFESEFLALKSFLAPKISYVVNEPVKMAVGAEEPIGRAYVSPSPDVAVEGKVSFRSANNLNSDIKD